MDKEELVAQIKEKRSFLCIGLDPEPSRIPEHLGHTPEGVVEFLKQIIDATCDLAVAYKPNLAFFEAFGESSWSMLKEVVHHIPENCFVIADAKRGDIGNTASKYAEAYFTVLGADAVTISPYMGKDSVEPFLGQKGKWPIVLGITSNSGASDIQMIECASGKQVFQETMSKATTWGGPEELMFVVGATRPELIQAAREIAPEHFFLVPGVGAQGGNLADVVSNGLTSDIGLLVNSSRGILYAGADEDFATEARKAAKALQEQMAELLTAEGIHA